MPQVDDIEGAIATAPGTRARARWLLAVKIVVSIGLLAVLFSYADMSTVLGRIAAADFGPIIWAFSLIAAQTFISAIKWKLILRSDAIEVSFPVLVRIIATSTFVNLFLPSSFGGDIYRVAALKESAGGLVRSMASVLFDRGTGLFALVTISVISYQFYPRNPYAVTFVAGWLGVMLAFAAATSQRMLESRFWPSFSLARHFRTLVSTLRVYRRSGGLLAGVIGLALVFQLTLVVVNELYSQALGIDVAFATLLVIIPLIYLTEAIPIGINGIGIRDSAFVLAFAAIGRPAEEALAISLLLISMRYLYGFICGSVVLIHYLLRRLN